MEDQEAYLIGGIVYNILGNADTSGTATVIAINVTKSTSEGSRVSVSGTTDPTDGSYALDMADETDENGNAVAYEDGDKLQIHTYDVDQSYYAGERHTLDISAGAPDFNLYLHPGGPHLGDCRLLGGFANNESTSASYFDIYDIENDAKVCRVNVATVSVESLPLSVVGRKMPGGMCIVYSGTDQAISFVRSVK